MAADHSEFDPLAAFSTPSAAQPTPNVNYNNAARRSVEAFDPFGSSVEDNGASTSNSNDNINTSNVNQRAANANATPSSIAMSPSAAAQADPFADLYASSRANNQQPNDQQASDLMEVEASLAASASTSASTTAAGSRVSPASLGVPATAEEPTAVVTAVHEASTAPTEELPANPLQQGQFNFQVRKRRLTSCRILASSLPLLLSQLLTGTLA